MISRFGWWLRSWYWCIAYVIRPYDILADRRRWFWQPEAKCWRSS